MKRLLVLILLALVLATSAPAFDFGVTVSNSLGVSGRLAADIALSEAVSAALWFDIPFTENIFLAAEGSYTFTLTRPVYLNLDYLEFSATLPLEFEGALTLAGGRLPFSDFTGYVYSDTADGIRGSLATGFLDVDLFAAFTGLTFANSSSILVSKQDLARRLDATQIFSPPRLVAGLSLGFPSIIEGHDLTIGSTFQFDLHDPANLVQQGATVQVEGGGAVHTQYVGISGNGPILPGLFYDAFVVANIGSMLVYSSGQYRPAAIFGLAGGGGVEWFPTSEIRPRIAATAVFATGDPDSTTFLEGSSDLQASAFVPLTSGPFGSLVSPRLHNIFIAALDFSAKPFAGLGTTVAQNITVGLANQIYVKPTAGAVSIQGLQPALGAAFLGYEANLSFTVRPTSELGLSLRNAFFVPNSAAFVDPTARYSVAFDLVLSF